MMMKARVREVLRWLNEGPRALLSPDDPTGTESWYDREWYLRLQEPGRLRFSSLTLYRLVNSDRILVRTFRSSLKSNFPQAAGNSDNMEVLHMETSNEQREAIQNQFRSLFRFVSAAMVADLEGSPQQERADLEVEKAPSRIYQCQIELFGSFQRLGLWVQEDHPLSLRWQEAWAACESIVSPCTRLTGFLERFDVLPARDHVDLRAAELLDLVRNAHG
jgi:hypothetical protein